MSAECHTDGYGIYLISDQRKELIGVREDDDRISYCIEKDTVKICARAFHKNKSLEVIELSASLETIEEDAFSSGPRNIHFINHSTHILYEDDFLIDAASHTLLLYTGNASEVTIPDTVAVIGTQAFRASAMETLILSAQITEIHSDALTTCRTERIFFAAWNTYVYFPKKDIRLRQHMLDSFGRNGIFDFARYDNDLLAGFLEDERMKMIAVRLKWPHDLQAGTEERYRTMLRENLSAVMQTVGNAKDLFTLQLFFETHVITYDNVALVMEVLHSLNDLEAYAYVDDYQNTHFQKTDFDFNI